MLAMSFDPCILRDPVNSDSSFQLFFSSWMRFLIAPSLSPSNKAVVNVFTKKSAFRTIVAWGSLWYNSCISRENA